MKNLHLIAYTTNDSGEEYLIGKIKNVDDEELKSLTQKALEEKRKFRELEIKVSCLEKDIEYLKQEIKVLKGEE